MGDEKPSRFGGRRSLKVSGEAATPIEPCEGPFDDAASRQELEAFGKAVSQALQQGDGAMDIVNIGGMTVDSQKEAAGPMPLACTTLQFRVRHAEILAAGPRSIGSRNSGVSPRLRRASNPPGASLMIFRSGAAEQVTT